MIPDQIHLLKTSRFLPLFMTQFFGAFNDNALKNAFLIWFTFDMVSYHHIKAPLMVTLASASFILPFFLFSATAGQVADKFEKSWLTKKIKQAEIILMIGSAVCFWIKSVYGLLFMLFLMGVQSTFFGPIKYSLLPVHLHEDELVSGNGLIEGGTFLSILLGTLFGGLIIRRAYGVELLSCCVTFFAIIGWIASRAIPKAPIGDSKLSIGWNIMSETWHILGYAREEPTVWLSIIGISWFWLIGSTFLTQIPTFTKEVIGGNEHIVTLFLTVFSVGIGIGSVWCNKLLKGRINGRLVPYGAIGISIAILLFIVASHGFAMDRLDYVGHVLKYQHAVLDVYGFFEVGLSSWGIVSSLLMLSICSGIYTVPLYAIMQHRSQSNYLARIIAANNVMNALFMVVASLVTMLMFSLHFTVIEVFLITGLLNFAVFLVVRRVVSRRLNHA